ncbi:hypothetical protein QQ73_04190, partial [Candidatus Endoriftia persephone str. Guaymas]|nr:hypothetical protein [Candidatus Endoriftia persephone str. Guaymas]
AVVVAEFYSDPQFRDRMSNLESLLASLQRYCADAKVIVLIEPQYRPKLEQVMKRYSIFGVVEFPLREERLESLLLQVEG